MGKATNGDCEFDPGGSSCFAIPLVIAPVMLRTARKGIIRITANILQSGKVEHYSIADIQM